VAKSKAMSIPAKLFYFSDLPKISKEEVRLNNLFYSNFLFLEQKNQLTTYISSALQTLLQSNVTFHLDQIVTQKSNFFLGTLQNNDCITVLSFPPKTGCFFLDMPSELAKTIVYRVLGKEDPISSNEQEMTEVEQGIFTFVVLKLLSLLRPPQNQDPHGQFQVIKIGQGTATFSPYLSDESSLMVLNFRGMINQQAFFMKIVISPELLQSSTSPGQNSETQLAMTLGLKRAFAMHVPVIAEVSQVSLHESDFKSLDIDDIIVLETNQVHLKTPGLVGDLHCKIGDEGFASFKGSLLLTKTGRYAIQVRDLIAAQDLSSKAEL
jgi:flagellar motor switch protein FliM